MARAWEGPILRKTWLTKGLMIFLSAFVSLLPFPLLILDFLRWILLDQFSCSDFLEKYSIRSDESVY